MNKPTLDEQYATAAVAESLAPDRRPITVVGAAGLAGRTHGLGFALWRLRYDGDSSGLAACRTELTRWLSRYARHHGLVLPAGDRLAVADAVLAWWVSASCRSCLGRGYRPIPGAPTLSDQVCPACQGHGRPTLEATLRTQWPKGAWQIDAGRWLLGELGDLEAATAHSMRKKLA